MSNVKWQMSKVEENAMSGLQSWGKMLRYAQHDGARWWGLS